MFLHVDARSPWRGSKSRPSTPIEAARSILIASIEGNAMTPDIINQIRNRLRETERPKKDSIGELADALYDDISAKLADGWTWK